MIEPSHFLAAATIAPVLGAAIIMITPRIARRSLFVGFLCIEGGSALVAAIAVISSGIPLTLALWRIAPLGRLSLSLDPIGSLFIGITVVVFVIGSDFAGADAGRYRGGRDGLFMALYQLLFGAIIVTLAASDILSFIVAWEVMSLLIYGLVVFDHEEPEHGRSAYLMLAMSEAGTIAGMAGLLLLAGASGSIEFASLRSAAPALTVDLSWAVFLLTFFGFGVKAGLVPVNQWLVDAYAAAPRGFAPVLAGATTNLGLYAILRIDAGILPTISVEPGLVALAVGSASALIGILYATIQNDMKRMLAYSSIENMGIMIAAFGAGLVFLAAGEMPIAAIAFVAALYHMVNHSIYKALLFTGVGAIEATTGSRDLDRLGGLMRGMPWTGALFLVGILAIAALPPLNGFVSEWLTLQTMLRSAVLGSVGTKVVFALAGAALALTAGLAATCFAKVFAMSFLGVARSAEAAVVRERRLGAHASMAVFAGLCLLLGVLPTYVIPALDSTVKPLVGASATEALVPPFFLTEGVKGAELPPAFRAEFHDLGAQAGQGLVPGRGLVVLHRGGERNPVVFAMSTSYMLVALAVLLGVALIAFRMLPRRRTVARAPAWAGGLRRLRWHITYTATGFSNPVRVVFHSILRPATIEDTTRAVAEHFRTAIRRERADVPLVDRVIFGPTLEGVRSLAASLRRMHIGHVNAYASYVLIALIVVFLVGLRSM